MNFLNEHRAATKRIQDKLQQLLKQHAAVQKENAALKQELQVAGKKISDSQQTIDELKQQTSILKVNADAMSDADKKNLKKAQSLHKEIDRCIALLGE
ncbi:MAG: hypothetical protein IPH18_15825 [Chitinophagaceae bacterium]|nr:hypothetical protein [Chitinophagaceae bacterium]